MTPRDMEAVVIDWAKTRDNVRVAILTSSRANPDAAVDELSDYDIEVFVRDLRPFEEGEQWLEPFGDVMVRKPYDSSIWEEDGHVGPMVVFTDGRRIDFNIDLVRVLEDNIARDDVEGHCRVLVDKDGITNGVEALQFGGGSYSHFLTQPPSEAEYLERVHNFWWNIAYVPKCLYRDQLFFAQYMLAGQRHGNLVTVLAWYTGMQKHWKNNPGVHGRHFKEQVDPALWSELEGTFAGADLEESWRATFQLARVFGRLASEVGSHLGYSYPEQVDLRVTEYMRWIHAMVDPGTADDAR